MLAFVLLNDVSSANILFKSLSKVCTLISQHEPSSALITDYITKRIH